MSIKCPKCGYERKPDDQAPEYECPSCGVIYAKFTMMRAGIPPDESRDSLPIPPPHASPEPMKVVITDIKIPFWTMVTLLIQITVASIPALLILGMASAGAIAIVTLIGLLGSH